MTAGLEHSRQRIDSDTAYNHAARTQDSARLGYTGVLGRHDPSGFVGWTDLAP